MNENIPVKNIWEAGIQKKRGRGKSREDLAGAVTKIILKKEEIIAQAKV